MLQDKTGNTFNTIWRGWNGSGAKSHPAGAIVRLKGYYGASNSIFRINGSDTIYRDFELLYSDPTRSFNYSVYQTTGEPGARPDAVDSRGPRNKFVNLVIHDACVGLGLWEQAQGNEAYGNILYNNGHVDTLRGHCQGLYMQNADASQPKKVTDVISFNNFDMGMKAFGYAGGLDGFQFLGVTSFNNGSPAAFSGNPSGFSSNYRRTGLFVGGDQPGRDISVRNSYLYMPPGTTIGNRLFALGWAGNGTNNINVVAQDNYVAGGNEALSFDLWNSATVTGNTFFATTSSGSANQRIVDANTPGSYNYTWNNNTYFDATNGSESFVRNGTAHTFSSWKSATGFDSGSTYTVGRPTGIKIFIRPNQFEAGRAHISIYNWDRANSVAVNLSLTGLTNGQAYEIRNAQNYFGALVLTGTYSASSPVVNISMTSAAATAVATPIGQGSTPATTLPEFGVFVVVPR